MKQKDVAIIIVVAVFAGIFSLVVSNILFGTSKRELTAQVVDSISSEFKKPDPRVFNENAINPTQLITIGDNAQEGQPSPF